MPPKKKMSKFSHHQSLSGSSAKFSTSEMKSAPPVPVQSIPNGNLFFMSSDFSDVILEAGGQNFWAHRVFLACASPVFRAMFQTQMKEASEGRVVIEDMKPKVLQELLHYVYNNGAFSEEEAFEELCVDLFKSADKYGIECLKLKCAKEIIQNVTLENALEMYILGDTHNQKMLMDRAVKVMKSNKQKFLKDPETLRDLANRYPQLAFDLATAADAYNYGDYYEYDT